MYVVLTTSLGLLACWASILPTVPLHHCNWTFKRYIVYNVLFMSMCDCKYSALGGQKREGIRSPRAGVTGSYDLTNMGGETNSGPLQKQDVLFVPEPFLLPPTAYLKLSFSKSSCTQRWHWLCLVCGISITFYTIYHQGFVFLFDPKLSKWWFVLCLPCYLNSKCLCVLLTYTESILKVIPSRSKSKLAHLQCHWNASWSSTWHGIWHAVRVLGKR